MYNYFAGNFTELLRVKGISQKQLAELLGVRPSTVNQWAKGKREPSFCDLVKITTLLNVDFNELMGQYICQRNKQAILRDIIGNSPEFQKEQAELQNRMYKEGKDAFASAKACEELYQKKYEEYKAIFGFES
ncbi:MAG: helix-turn-helix transcriptional regulator [Clostridia bacterium]|nr:helix-turn-helix transcriptional regulator [Clostridia bacterium]